MLCLQIVNGIAVEACQIGGTNGKVGTVVGVYAGGYEG